jgi:GDSL-like Lipase/Acylhydrolase family
MNQRFIRIGALAIAFAMASLSGAHAQSSGLVTSAQRILRAMSRAAPITIMASPPTITKGTAFANSTVNSAFAVATPQFLLNSPNITFLNGLPGSPASSAGNSVFTPAWVTSTGGAGGGGAPGLFIGGTYGFCFMTDSDAVDVAVNGFVANLLRFRVNGQFTSGTDLSLNAGDVSYYTIAFGGSLGAAMRKIEIFNQLTGGLSGIVVQAGASVIPCAQPDMPAAMFLGDSYVFGGPTFGQTSIEDSFAIQAGVALGLDNVICSGAPGRGWISSANGSTLSQSVGADSGRFGSMDLIVLNGSINDTTATGLQAAVMQGLLAVRKANPNAVIVFLTGFQAASGGMTAAVSAANLAGAQAAAANAINPITDASANDPGILVVNTFNWFTAASTATYFTTNTSHPNTLGGALMASNIQSALYPFLSALVAQNTSN